MAQFTNQATLSYNGNTVNSNIVTGNIVEVLTISKTVVGDGYASGDTLTYIVSLANSGTTAISGVTLTDNLGAYTFGTGTVTPLDYVDGSVVYYQNGVLQTAPTVTSGTTLSFSGITVPAGGNAILVYEAKVNAYAPLETDSTITNEVTATAAAIGTPLTDEATVTVRAEADLSITKCLSPVNVTENGELTYTFTIQNMGNTAAGAADSVVITDMFDPILSNISVTVNGTTLAATDYSYDTTTGLFTTTVGAITVPAATYTTDTTGQWMITPGVTTVTVTGTV